MAMRHFAHYSVSTSFASDCGGQLHRSPRTDLTVRRRVVPTMGRNGVHRILQLVKLTERKEDQQKVVEQLEEERNGRAKRSKVKSPVSG